MHLQILLLSTVLVCVCSLYVPDQSRLASYLRSRRDALSNPHFQQKSLNNKNIANGTSYERQKENLPYHSNNKRSLNKREEYETKQEYANEDNKIIQKRYSQPNFQEEEHYGHPKYNFKYTVHDVEHQDIKHHQEERDGELTVGEYSVLQPDGTILTVKYTVHADEGFNAVVSKSEV